MDSKFHSAVEAVKAGDIDRLRALIHADPTLATCRSRTSHPTLLQCLVLNEKDVPAQLEIIRLLIDYGAELNGPLSAAAGIGNVAAAALLLERSAAVNGTGGWSPLEEALYWNQQEAADLLLQRGAKIQNLRTAAGLGRTDLIASFFKSDGGLRPEAGKINWPWGDLNVIAQSNHPAEGKQKLAAKYSTFKNDPQDVVNNAFVYACMHGHIKAAQLLLERGAEINSIPGGFDFSGTALHYAALNGHTSMVEFLLDRGADPNIRDTNVDNTPAGWAGHGGHNAIRDLLNHNHPA